MAPRDGYVSNFFVANARVNGAVSSLVKRWFRVFRHDEPVVAAGGKTVGWRKTSSSNEKRDGGVGAASLGTAMEQSRRREVLIEGMSEDEILALPLEQLRSLVGNAEPLVFRIGSATVLGEFRIERSKLRLELAQIEGGGEGVLLTLGSLARRFARLNGIREIEWAVHAVHCAKPNFKLRRVLDRRGSS